MNPRDIFNEQDNKPPPTTTTTIPFSPLTCSRTADHLCCDIGALHRDRQQPHAIRQRDLLFLSFSTYDERWPFTCSNAAAVHVCRCPTRGTQPHPVSSPNTQLFARTCIFLNTNLYHNHNLFPAPPPPHTHTHAHTPLSCHHHTRAFRCDVSQSSCSATRLRHLVWILKCAKTLPLSA
jgi:hypothetical protein